MKTSRRSSQNLYRRIVQKFRRDLGRREWRERERQTEGEKGDHKKFGELEI